MKTPKFPKNLHETPLSTAKHVEDAEKELN